MDNRLYTLLKQLAGEAFIPVDVLAWKLQLSEKTTRNLIKQLAESEQEYGCRIEKQYGKGIRLCVTDEDLFAAICDKKENIPVPVTSGQRVRYLLVRFLTSASYIKVEDLCEELYISRKTVSAELKCVREHIGLYRLALETKPRYGVKVTGKEFDIRQCLGSMQYMMEEPLFHTLAARMRDKGIIWSCMEASLKRYGCAVYESDIPNLIFQIQVALFRFEGGWIIGMEEADQNSFLQEKDILTAQACAHDLQEQFHLVLPVSEIKYLAIQLSGKKQAVSRERDNQVIDMEINQLVNDMLDNVWQVLGVDLKSDFNLHMSLCQHLISLRIRLRYHLRLNNPMLKEIREVYSFPYEVAAQASAVLAEYFHCVVHEEEIGYLALCFALAIERRKKSYKRNIILVCASGEGSAKLFEYRFRQIFGEYLSQVRTCGLDSLDGMDFTDADYVFSTVPIEKQIPVPIYQVQYFFDRYNYQELKRILTNSNGSSIRDYFYPDLFFTDIKGDSREEILHEMCGRIAKRRNVPGDFEACVMQREQMMQTDFCGRIAIPHPYTPVTEETFVCVAVLKKPVHWYAHDVQVIFLLSVSINKENLENFYQIAPQFMMNEAYISAMIKSPFYDTLMDMLGFFEEKNE